MKDRTRVKELKQKLSNIQDELHDLMIDFGDLDYDVEIHMLVVGDHYQTDILRLFKEEDFEDEK